MNPTRRSLLAGAAGLAGCAMPPATVARCDVPAGGPGLWLAERDWHTEIGVAPEGPLSEFAPHFAQPALLVFGFGKRHFMLAMPPGPGDYIAGLLPGAGAMEVIARESPPAGMLPLGVTSDGLARLRIAIRASFTRELQPVETRSGSAFYAASRGYSLAYTCNSWTAEMLAVAGLPVRPGGVVLKRHVMDQIRACRGMA